MKCMYILYKFKKITLDILMCIIKSFIVFTSIIIIEYIYLCRASVFLNLKKCYLYRIRSWRFCFNFKWWAKVSNFAPILVKKIRFVIVCLMLSFWVVSLYKRYSYWRITVRCYIKRVKVISTVNLQLE